MRGGGGGRHRVEGSIARWMGACQRCTAGLISAVAVNASKWLSSVELTQSLRKQPGMESSLSQPNMELILESVLFVAMAASGLCMFGFLTMVIVGKYGQWKRQD